MIARLSHATIYVEDQDTALAFYRDKLGFEVRADFKTDDFRWTTVGPKSQKDVEIILMEPKLGPMYDEETVSQLKSLIKKGALGAGVFYTDDCRKTYEELSARGVEFVSEPADKFYGVEAMMKDNSGNWFSLTQPKEMA
jgi:catechol 2,3-dioxygenase-like lactoylglutathione lyase family enzyme